MIKVILSIIVLSLTMTAFDCRKTGPSFPPTANLGPMPDNPNAIWSGNIILNDWTRRPTAKGMQVQAYDDPSQQVRNLADSGVQKTIDVASREYKDVPGHVSLIAAFFNVSRYCDGVTTSAVPAFMVWSLANINTAHLDNSEWDKDARRNVIGLCVVGAFTYANGRPMISLVNDARIVETAAQYEAEHYVLSVVDPVRFNATALHWDGQGHPIFAGNTLATESSGLTFSGIETQGIKASLILTK